MKNKAVKGQPLYLVKKRKQEIIKTFILFALPLSLYIAGYISTGSNKNYLTIIAVLGCLPACKNTVSLIMYLRFKGCDDTKMIELSNSEIPQENVMFDMVFTSYDKNYNISHLIIKNGNLCGFTEDLKMETSKCEEHIQTMLHKSGIKSYNIKIFNDYEKYKNRLKQLVDLEDNTEKLAEVRETLSEISL